MTGLDTASPARIARFTAVMYKPQYLLYGILWVAALEACASRVESQVWHPGADTAARIVVVVLVLLFLRMVDEQKDLDYDRIHHPDRPLVTGAVTTVDLRVAMAVIAVVVVAISAWLSAASAVAILVVLGYGVGLWAAESAWPALRSAILLNLAVTYPVQLLLMAYVVVSAHDTGQLRVTGALVLVPVLLTASFLQFEFARKISRRDRPDEMYYSSALGTRAAIAVAMGCVVITVCTALVITTAWQQSGFGAALAWAPLVLAVLPLGAVVGFMRSDQDDLPAAPAAVFVLAVYASLIAAVAVLPAGWTP